MTSADQKEAKAAVMYQKSGLTIKSWAEADRPREKLQKMGKQTLSDAELLAILLGSGSRNETAVDLAKRILKSVNNNLNELGKASLSALMKFKGIGAAKAITIVAALELGRRRQATAIIDRPQIKSSRDAYNIVAHQIMDLLHEEFWILLLNRGNRVVQSKKVSSGGTAGTVVDAKIIFKIAIEASAAHLILCHNHPSGNLMPSQADVVVTKKIVEAGRLLDITVLDHLIIGGVGYYSFADEGLI